MNAPRSLALVLALSAAAGLQAQTPPALAPLLQADGALNPAWRFVGFPKQQARIAPTHFEAGVADDTRAVQVRTEASYGTLVQDWRGPAPARLQWRWRLDKPLSGGTAPADILTKAGDDAALKVCVMFDHPLERVPFVERTVLRIARSVSGEALPAATLCYVWDSGHAAGRQGANPYTRRVRYISLRGSEARKLLQCVEHLAVVPDECLELTGADLHDRHLGAVTLHVDVDVTIEVGDVEQALEVIGRGVAHEEDRRKGLNDQKDRPCNRPSTWAKGLHPLRPRRVISIGARRLRRRARLSTATPATCNTAKIRIRFAATSWTSSKTSP